MNLLNAPSWVIPFAQTYHTLGEDIFKFAIAIGMGEPTAQQAAVMMEVQRGATHLAVKSGQGIGKTAVETIIGAWRAFRRFMAQTVVLAPTQRQSKDIWLGELRLWLSRADPNIARLFDCQTTRVNICGIRDWGIRLLPVGGGKSQSVSGEHNDYLTIIVDEAAGISRVVLETMFGTLTNADPLLATFGNPNVRDCGFFDCFNRDRHLWTTFTFNAEESPLANRKNIARLDDIYGRESDVFRVRVLGEFPDQDPDCVMSSDDLEACARNDMLECAMATDAKQFGIDLAAFGSDESVIYRRSGLAVTEWARYAKTDPMIVLANAFAMQDRVQWRNDKCLYVYDVGGMGEGREMLFGDRQFFGFRHNAIANNAGRFDDRITEAFFHLGALAKARAIHIPNDPMLIHQLSTRKYALTKHGKLKVDSKDDWKDDQQEKRSPDRADALVFAFYQAPMSVQAMLDAPRRRRPVSPGSLR